MLTITDMPKPNLSTEDYTDVFDADAMQSFTSNNEHESATNTGSLLLWGSSAYPRMDRAGAERFMGRTEPGSQRVLAVGGLRGPSHDGALTREDGRSWLQSFEVGRFGADHIGRWVF